MKFETGMNIYTENEFLFMAWYIRNLNNEYLTQEGK